MGGFPGGPAGQESTCNAGDPGSIPGSERKDKIPTLVFLGFPGGSNGKESCNLPAMWEIWVQFLDWEDPLEKEMTTHSSTVAWRIPWTIQSQRVGHS